MSKIVLTGFKPFLGDPINPSEIICQNISIPGVCTQVLSVDFYQAFEELKITLKKENPEYVVSLGVASSRVQVSLEKVALNWNESKHPDEAGQFVSPAPIQPSDDRLALMTKFPINELQDFLVEKKYPVKISFSAGTYVCNNVYYKILAEFPDLKTIFIHVPIFENLNQELQVQMVHDVLNYIQNLKS
ncbi:MAG: pyroglutamyl-peptidase I [Moraxellaceae bacterium]|nr:pyroglutamyl-peptidase I [Pseudobdellovibrionaceae bacterium]